MAQPTSHSLPESIKKVMEEARAINEPQYVQLLKELHHLKFGFPSAEDENLDAVVALEILNGTYSWWGPVYQSPGLELVERLASVEQIVSSLKTHPLITKMVDEEMKEADRTVSDS